MNILFRVFFRILPISMFLILINTALGWSAVQVGQVGILRGEVEAISIDEKVRSLQIKSPVYQDETIRTGKGGQLQIFFEDESIFTLGPSSEVKIDKFVFDPAKAKGRFLVKVGRGAFRLVTGLISRNSPKDVTVETETAVIGVRGCYLASVLGDQGKLTVLYLGGERGRERGISIGNKLGTINITTSGFGTTVQSSQDPPSPPMRFSTEDMKEILAPTELGERQEQEEKGEPRRGEEREGRREEKQKVREEAKQGVEQEVKAPPPPDALPPPPRRPPPQETRPLVRTTAPDPSITTGLQGEQLTGVKQEGTVSLEGFYVMFSGSDKWQGDISGTGKGSTRALTLLRSGETSQELSLTGSHINLSASSLMVYNEETSTSNTLWGHDLNELFRAYDVWGGLFTFEAWDVKGSDTTVYIIGYAGTKTLGALPTSGIGIYKGQAGHTSTTELFGAESRQGDYEDVEAKINWATGRVFLSIKPGETVGDIGTVVFLGGTVDRDAKTISGTVVGKQSNTNTTNSAFIKSDSGLFNFGIYGKEYQAIAGHGEGGEFRYDGTSTGSWIAGVTLWGNPPSHLSQESTDTFNGFAAGFSIPRTATGTLSNLTILTNYNNDPDDLTLNINRDEGTVGGTLHVADANSTHDLTFTYDATDSTYVDDHAFINTHVSLSGTVSASAPASATLTSDGVHYIATAPFHPFSWEDEYSNYENTKWGIWASEHVAGSTYHNVSPHSLWIAGNLTPAAEIPTSATGTYSGNAYGYAYYSGASSLYGISGTSDLTANFENRTLTGTLTMEGTNPATSSSETWSVGVDGSWSSGSNSITGTPSSWTINGTSINQHADSKINAAFTGPNAHEIMGNWVLQETTSTRKSAGIVVGKR